ncbi:Fur family transcriptional regulator [Leadbetterella byssophila]|uniref:Fur family transcriptional regulator n=1 Tax=Leadbetterella byssophila TaxID=316068 RepID=UPI0039A38151
MNSNSHILRDNGLRVTETRQVILDKFQERQSAISQSDIEADLGADIDRVTVYRTLKTFVERGIIHKILDDKGGVKYAMCKESCSHGDHHHDHLHFKCSVCQETTCLEKHLIPKMQLPEGYQQEEVNILVQGICPNCK